MTLKQLLADKGVDLDSLGAIKVDPDDGLDYGGKKPSAIVEIGAESMEIRIHVPQPA